MSKLNKKQQAEFAKLEKAIKASEQGYIFAKSEAVAPFVAAGLVETNETIVDSEGGIAVRLAQVANSGEGESAQAETATQTQTETAEPGKTEKVKTMFQIEDSVPVPAISGRGRGGTTYPFEQLAVGQSFFVPNSEDKPNAAKSLASTVSSATARYAVPSADGATKTNKKGETVPVMVETRKFIVRSVEGGARVWRTA